MHLCHTGISTTTGVGDYASKAKGSKAPHLAGNGSAGGNRLSAAPGTFPTIDVLLGMICSTSSHARANRKLGLGSIAICNFVFDSAFALLFYTVLALALVLTASVVCWCTCVSSCLLTKTCGSAYALPSPNPCSVVSDGGPAPRPPPQALQRYPSQYAVCVRSVLLLSVRRELWWQFKHCHCLHLMACSMLSCSGMDEFFCVHCTSFWHSPRSTVSQRRAITVWRHWNAKDTSSTGCSRIMIDWHRRLGSLRPSLTRSTEPGVMTRTRWHPPCCMHGHFGCLFPSCPCQCSIQRFHMR